jgi:hypothetical protein
MHAILAEWLSEVPDNPFEWKYWKYMNNDHYMPDFYENEAEFKDDVEWLKQAEKFDVERFHDQRFDVNFADWKRAYWNVQQATALTFGKDPTIVTSAYALEVGSSPSRFTYYYKGVRDRILKAQSDGRLGDPIRPRVYIEWARDAGIPLPDGLEEAAPEGDDQLDDYKWLYRLANEDNKRLRQENQRLQSELALQSQRSDAADSAPLRTGAPGRPSKSMHLILDEYQRRLSCGATPASTEAEAESLLQWLRDIHPAADRPTAKTIGNRIRPLHRNAKKPRN